jgi:hypothetical protein
MSRIAIVILIYHRYKPVDLIYKKNKLFYLYVNGHDMRGNFVYYLHFENHGYIYISTTFNSIKNLYNILVNFQVAK